MNYNTQPTCDLRPDSVPELNLELIRKDLEILAKETVDKTLAQAKAARTDPVLGSSSTLATFYMMFPRNDGITQEKILGLTAQHIEELTIINKSLKFGIDPKYLSLIQSNDTTRLAGLQTDYDPEPKGPTYRPDALIVNRMTRTACLVDFKRQVSTIETTKLNRIADNLMIARAQVRDFLYQKHKRMTIDEGSVSWAIIDCSDQKDLPPRFKEAGVFGLDSLDTICGVKNIAKAYRLAREYMAKEFIRGEAELMAQSDRFIATQVVNELVDEAVKQAKQTFATNLAHEDKNGTSQTDEVQKLVRLEQKTEHQAANVQILPRRPDMSLRRQGMFGT
ncbi:MAG: hypothetical protein JJ858_13065 [Rhizobiaceae bacterium]|nr:hypothetical protein [Rhizobiaceae bacterium]